MYKFNYLCHFRIKLVENASLFNGSLIYELLFPQQEDKKLREKKHLDFLDILLKAKVRGLILLSNFRHS